jgi:hypothetical protein
MRASPRSRTRQNCAPHQPVGLGGCGAPAESHVSYVCKTQVCPLHVLLIVAGFGGLFQPQVILVSAVVFRWHMGRRLSKASSQILRPLARNLTKNDEGICNYMHSVPFVHRM